LNALIVTVDIDWACEPAIEETLDALLARGITPTLFTTHDSPRVRQAIDEMEVGLHPFFDPASSQGSTIGAIVEYVAALPHNLPAYRCHRFGTNNAFQQAMAEAGMLASSNVCTDLEVVAPFRNRLGLLEIPIFMEDGGYLQRGHPLDLHDALLKPGLKTLLIHPMHFALNTPHFDYMLEIKRSLNRSQWQTLTTDRLDEWRWRERGIRDLIVGFLDAVPATQTFGEVLAQHGLRAPQP